VVLVRREAGSRGFGSGPARRYIPMGFFCIGIVRRASLGRTILRADDLWSEDKHDDESDEDVEFDFRF
jgi:hypothetical protein